MADENDAPLPNEVPVSEKQVEAFSVNPVYNKLADDQKIELLKAIEDWVISERKIIRGQ